MSTLTLNQILTPFNQNLAQKCCELKCFGKIHSSWSSKGVIKQRWTVKEKAISILHDGQNADLYPDFVFKEKQSRNRDG